MDGTPTAPPVPGPTPYDKQIGYTVTGLSLLSAAVLLQWIPVIEYLGFVLGAIGAIEMIRGAPAFRGRHELLVWASVILFVCSELFAFGFALSFASTVTTLGSSTGPAAANRFLSAWQALVEGVLVTAALISVCYLLIAVDLADPPGKLLLAAGVIVQVVLAAALFVLVLNPVIVQAVTQAFASNPVDVSVIQAADAQINGLGWLKLFNAIPAVLFAVGYVRARGRVTRAG